MSKVQSRKMVKLKRLVSPKDENKRKEGTLPLPQSEPISKEAQAEKLRDSGIKAERRAQQIRNEAQIRMHMAIEEKISALDEEIVRKDQIANAFLEMHWQRQEQMKNHILRVQHDYLMMKHDLRTQIDYNTAENYKQQCSRVENMIIQQQACSLQLSEIHQQAIKAISELQMQMKERIQQVLEYQSQSCFNILEESEECTDTVEKSMEVGHEVLLQDISQNNGTFLNALHDQTKQNFMQAKEFYDKVSESSTALHDDLEKRIKSLNESIIRTQENIKIQRKKIQDANSLLHQRKKTSDKVIREEKQGSHLSELCVSFREKKKKLEIQRYQFQQVLSQKRMKLWKEQVADKFFEEVSLRVKSLKDDITEKAKVFHGIVDELQPSGQQNIQESKEPAANEDLHNNMDSHQTAQKERFRSSKNYTSRFANTKSTLAKGFSIASSVAEQRNESTDITKEAIPASTSESQDSALSDALHKFTAEYQLLHDLLCRLQNKAGWFLTSQVTRRPPEADDSTAVQGAGRIKIKEIQPTLEHKSRGIAVHERT